MTWNFTHQVAERNAKKDIFSHICFNFSTLPCTPRAGFSAPITQFLYPVRPRGDTSGPFTLARKRQRKLFREVFPGGCYGNRGRLCTQLCCIERWISLNSGVRVGTPVRHAERQREYNFNVKWPLQAEKKNHYVYSVKESYPWNIQKEYYHRTADRTSRFFNTKLPHKLINGYVTCTTSWHNNFSSHSGTGEGRGCKHVTRHPLMQNFLNAYV